VGNSVEPATVQGGVIGAAATATGTGAASTSSTAKPSGAEGMWSRIARAGAVAGVLGLAVGLLMV
jgi:hypothetical protein